MIYGINEFYKIVMCSVVVVDCELQWFYPVPLLRYELKFYIRVLTLALSHNVNPLLVELLQRNWLTLPPCVTGFWGEMVNGLFVSESKSIYLRNHFLCLM